ncbi:GGDEF domain-containing protein [Komagataeibacter oboediens]|uniref:bifunctional diguanylate cyclase/phosphodiesterase n=1 Tax=Komagataeibacter oboediens TaxID=65958 RepID=UPI001C2C97CB|nr:GGDEF domain-containing protein [Komagataeibacter oboediens]MBV0889547.1 GGDEF domain-containing protein [Komagataeibacter oboediens]
MTINPGPKSEVTDYEALYRRIRRRYEREREVRMEAERIAEDGLSQLYARNRQQALMEAVAAQANSGLSVEDIVRFAFSQACEMGPWCMALAWLPDSKGSGRVFRLASHLSGHENAAAGRALPTGPDNALLPSICSRLQIESAPLWLVGEGTRAGMQTVLMVPVMVSGRMAMVLEFDALSRHESDPYTLAMFSNIARQLSHVLERRETADLLRHEATHDALTGLPNRKAFLARLDAIMERDRKTGHDHAVMFIDLDKFKMVNDSFGHHAGDMFLIEIVNRLRRVFDTEENCFIARLGGDEFTAIMTGQRDRAALEKIGARICQELELEMVIDGHHLRPSASIGIVTSDHDHKSSADIVRDADLAMYEAKRRGGDRVILFTPDLLARMHHALILQGELPDALERNEFLLHYQPIVDVQAGRVVGHEALLRWRDRRGVLHDPAAFIRNAEETGLIVPIGNWVLEQALRHVVAFNRDQAPGHEIAAHVNLSANQLRQPDMPRQVRELLAATGAKAEWIVLEITEDALLPDMDASIRHLAALRGAGARIAINSFGGGRSSLSHLGTIPFDIIKTDRGFVKTMGTHGHTVDVLRLMADLGERLDKTVIIEGVETQAEQDQLRALGFRYMQGFHIGRPV